LKRISAKCRCSPPWKNFCGRPCGVGAGGVGAGGVGAGGAGAGGESTLLKVLICQKFGKISKNVGKKF